MATTEHTINDALADLLRGTRRAWRNTKIVTSEDTGQLKDTSGRPDILVVEPNVCPVVIETEVVPAVTVEAEALSRLGAKMRTTGRTILSSVAVRRFGFTCIAIRVWRPGRNSAVETGARTVNPWEQIENEVNRIALVLDSQENAERFVTALKHAVSLCGSAKSRF
jgi:hypothetical protein